MWNLSEYRNKLNHKKLSQNLIFKSLGIFVRPLSFNPETHPCIKLLSPAKAFHSWNGKIMGELYVYIYDAQGPDSVWRCHLTSIGNPIVEIRRSYDRLISTMGFPILVRQHLYIESGPWLLVSPGHQQLWHWLCRIHKSLSSTRKVIGGFHVISFEKWNNLYTVIFHE